MKFTSICLAATLSAAIAMTSANTAFAINTVFVDGTSTPPGSASLNVGTPLLSSFELESNYGSPTSCTGVFGSGYLIRGASATANSKIGEINAFNFASCSASVLNFPVNAIQKQPPGSWSIYLDETPAKGQRIVKVKILDVDLEMSNYNVGGTCAFNATGTLSATIDAWTDQLIINTPALSGSAQTPLTVDALDRFGAKGGATTFTCGGDIYDGDLMSMAMTFDFDRDIAF